MTRGFPDHHFFTRDDLADLAATAADKGLELITTAKDAVRLRHGASHEQAIPAPASRCWRSTFDSISP